MTNHHSKKFYRSQIQLYQATLNNFKLKFRTYSLARILVYIAGVIGVYIYFYELHIVIPLAIIAVVVFLLLLVRHINLKTKRKLYRALLDINIEEFQISEGSFKDRNEGKMFQDYTHAF